MSKKRRRKLSIPGMIIIGLAFALVVFMLVLLMKYFFLDRNKTVHKDKEINNSQEVNNNDESDVFDYGITFTNCIYYVTDETDFNFAIAEINLTNTSISYDMEDFVTSENIKLSDTSLYLNKLNNAGIYPGIIGVENNLPIKEGEFHGLIFIPIKDKKASMIKISYKEQSFDLLLNNKGDLETMMYKVESEVTDEETFKLKITGIENLTGIYLEENSEPYELGSQTQLYGLMCDVQCLNNDPFIVESAYFEDSNGYVYTALGSEIKAFDVDNLVGLRVLKASTGAILFELINPADNQKTLYYGKLHVKLNDDAKEYIINVSLN